MEFRRQRWSIGCETWPGKPRFALVRAYYDGWHIVLHLGPFWFELNHL